MANKSKSYPVNREKFLETFEKYQKAQKMMPTVDDWIEASGIPRRTVFAITQKKRLKEEERAK